MAVPVCLALAAREGAVREGFLEKASTQRPIGGMGVRLGRRGPWRGVVLAEGTSGGRHGGTSTQEWVRDGAGAGSRAEELGALSLAQGGTGMVCSMFQLSWCPGLVQHAAGVRHCEDWGGTRQGSRRGGGPQSHRVQETFREDGTSLGACWRWEGGRGRWCPVSAV